MKAKAAKLETPAILICMAIGSISVAQFASAQQTSSSPAAPPHAQHRAVLDRYCITCHNQTLRTAELALDTYDLADVRKGAATWEKVVRKLRTGAMPPAGAPRPDPKTSDQLASFLEIELDHAAKANLNPGRTAIHRLNRVEYANVIRDLLAVEIDGAALLPPDDASYGFDNIAEVLSISPLLVERYMAAAQKISRLAVGDAVSTAVTEIYTLPVELAQHDRMSEDLPFGSRGGLVVRHYFPVDGEYVINVRMQRNADNYIRGLGEPHELDVRLDGTRLKLFRVGGANRGKSGPLYSFVNKDYRGEDSQENYETTGDEGIEVRFPATAGPHVVGVTFLKETYEPETVLMPSDLHSLFADRGDYKGGDPLIGTVGITGPYDAKGLSETPSRQRIFECRPDNSQDEEACAKRILSGLARRAYRKPVTQDDLRPLLDLYRAGRSEGGFENGIEMALRAILVSVDFLFRIERDPDGIAPATAFRVSDLELASRLSFFLWSSIPDDELLELAAAGRLKDPAALRQQVSRMLADTRSNVLMTNFAGQWLYLRNMSRVSPDPRVFPYFDESLREAFHQEAQLFVESIAREDRSVLDLLDADYTFLNERLAQHYGIPGIYGSHFRRVELKDPSRKGLLGKAGILTVTSYANRTSPTLRGKWVLENVLGTPPPLPPPNVPSLKEDNVRNGKTLTMRERMEEHRTNAVCASCHARMDPIGLALDNFDALGKWRTEDGGTPIDPSGTLPDGAKFQGPAELVRILAGRREQVAHAVAERLLTYALGRGLEYYDAPAIREVLRKSASSDYRWSSLIQAIVESVPFQMGRSAEQP